MSSTIENRLERTTLDILNNIGKNEVSGSVKVEIFKTAFEAVMQWPLTTNKETETFIKTLTLKVNKMIRKWLKLPPGSTEKSFYLPFKLGGLNLPNLETIWKKCEISRLFNYNTVNLEKLAQL